jgi:hypothetical protein
MATGIAIDSTHAIAGLGFRVADFLYQAVPRVAIYGRPVPVATRPESDFMMADFWLYNAEKDRWKRLPAQKSGRRGAVSFLVGNYLYVGMGNAENRISKDVYRLDLSRLRR